jgi:membrane-associated phospholipid phosphatase
MLDSCYMSLTRASSGVVLAITLVCVPLGAHIASAQETYSELFQLPVITEVPEATDVPQAQTQSPPPAQPEHTGFSALIRATGADFAAFPRRPSTWVILGAGLAAAAITHPLDDNIEQHEFSKGSKDFFVLGKYLGQGYTQFAIAGGLYVIGRYVQPHEPGAPRTNKLSHLGFDLVRANIVSGVIVQGIKVAVRRDRPTGNCCAFPSGHAATAFATASVLERHLGYRGAWPTMVGATYVAISRIADQQHFLSDVVFGSALGIATGWTVVGRHGRSNYALMPVPVRGGVAVMLMRRPPDARANE